MLARGLRSAGWFSAPTASLLVNSVSPFGLMSVQISGRYATRSAALRGSAPSCDFFGLLVTFGVFGGFS